MEDSTIPPRSSVPVSGLNKKHDAGTSHASGQKDASVGSLRVLGCTLGVVLMGLRAPGPLLKSPLGDVKPYEGYAGAVLAYPSQG